MTKLGIIGAMQEEVENLLAQTEQKKELHKAGSVFYEGILEGLPVVIVQCGVGKVNAAMCTQVLCDLFDVTHIVNTGIAGSLCAELDIGDLLVSQSAMYHDFDCTNFGYPFGKVPGLDVTAFPADETLIRYAFEAAEAVNPGHTRIGRVARRSVCGGSRRKGCHHCPHPRSLHRNGRCGHCPDGLPQRRSLCDPAGHLRQGRQQRPHGLPHL